MTRMLQKWRECFGFFFPVFGTKVGVKLQMCVIITCAGVC